VTSDDSPEIPGSRAVTAGVQRPAIVITGASAGIGRAIAIQVARERSVVVLVARSSEGLNATAEEVRRAGGEAFCLELDLAESEALARLDRFLSDQGLVCDVLVNNAGYGLRGDAAALPAADQIGIIDLNMRALAALTLHFLPGMVARGRGGVINLGSVAGFLPGPHMAMYYASKAFVRSFSEALHEEVRGKGVTVTCVAPGPVRTKFLEKAGAKRTPLFRLLPKADAQFVAECAWRGFKHRRRMVIPGLQAKSAALFAKLLPSAATLWLIGRLQSRG
jgi:short-subunit dehydrogenase